MRIFARNTTIKNISDEVADQFIELHHRQGNTTYGKNRYNFGIYYNDKLYGVASFSNTRTSGKAKLYQQELVRLAFPEGVTVVGGASKLIKHYIRTVKPRNFFTYQTLSEAQSDVYELSGMTYRKQNAKKDMLVKDGYTYETAVSQYRKTGEKYLYLNALLVNLGPDQLLGTTIGSVYNDGRRLTNKELFVKYCGYHVETVHGDRVYDYNNPEYTHYIYKITNDNPMDNRYYIGRHSTYADHQLTETELINDGYMGSGGDKFQNWKSSSLDKGYNLSKEILEIVDRYDKLGKTEARYIRDLYKTDANCLNSTMGGTSVAISTSLTPYEDSCNTHGETIFRAGVCCKCSASKSLNVKTCNVHGEVFHRGDHCLKCVAGGTFNVANCDIHGDVIHNKNQCTVCQSTSILSVKTCDIHGETLFSGDSCCKCTANKGLDVGICEIHGETKFRAGRCMACQVNSTVIETGYCEKHGDTPHKGGKCMKCWSARKTKICPIHGECKFTGDKCLKCMNQASVKLKHCEIHGETKFQGNNCCKCVAKKRADARKRKLALEKEIKK